MKNNKVVLIVVFCITSIIGFSQQDALYTQYMFNQMSVNPGYTGTSDVLNITAASRWQWIAIDGSPITNTLSLNTPIKRTNLGVGFTAVNDRIGPVEQTGIYGNISYQVKLSRKTKLSFGLKGGVNLLDIGLKDIKNIDQDDYTFYNNISQIAPNFGFGVYYYSPNKFYLGLSTPKLLESSANNKDVVYLEKRHYFATGGYVFKVNNDVDFTPSFLVKYIQNTPISVDISANLLINDLFWLGVMYRNGDALGGIIQLQLTNQLKFGYSYDYTLSELKTFTSGSHEVTLSYDFRFNKKGIMSPRMF